jgi:von Willebrand factor type A domain
MAGLWIAESESRAALALPRGLCRSSRVIDLLLKFCGVKLESASKVSGAELALRNSSWLPWIVVLAVVLLSLAWFSYWRDAREIASNGKRRLLTGLRMLLFVLLLLLLLRPVIAFTLESSIRRTLLALVDVSGSMKIQDPRFDPSDLKRAAIAKGVLDPRKGLEQTLDSAMAAQVKLMPRVEVMRGMLKNDSLKLWPEIGKDLDLAAFTFGQTLAEAGGDMAWLDSLDPKATATALGDGVRELLTRKRGQALAGVFLATDGASNYGSPPAEAARLAKQEGVPLFIYGVGITSPRDIIVASVLTQDIAFVNDELPVTVRARGQGLKGESAKLVMRLVPASGGEGEVVAEKELTFSDDEDLVLPMPFTPKQTGEYELRTTIAPRDDEASKDNNAITQRLRVIDSKVKVLFVETTPRWEFRYLQSALLRDRRLDVKYVLFEGDAGIAQAESSPYLPKVPATREEIFKFDLIVLGDVAPKDFTTEQLGAFEEFVQKFGGAMLIIAGPRNAPATFGGSVLEKLLPVELDPAQQPALGSGGIVVELTPQGRAHPMLKLAADDADNAAVWRKFGKIFSAARVLRAKPAAQVLLTDADQTRANRHGKLVLAAEHQYGLGRVFYMGTDNTWRWRRNAGDKLYALLWGQIAQKLGLHHLLGGSKRTQLTVDKQSYTTGERVTVYGRLYGADYSPVRDTTVEAGFTVRVAGAAGPSQTVTLRAVPDQPGMYCAEFVATQPGLHQFAVKSDPGTVAEFNVVEPRFESGETAMNETQLREMAEASGGAYFREENLWQLPQTISAKAERITTTVDGELWASPFVFLLLLLTGSVEWLLRKRWQLK